MSTSHNPDELKAIEKQLRGLEPQSRLSRDQLLFAAGRASVPARGWWPQLSGLLTLLVVGLAGWLVLKPAPAPQFVYIERPANHFEPRHPYEPEPIAPGDYLRQREEMLEQGRLPAVRGPGKPAASDEQFEPIWTPTSRINIE